jgi:hypothetical protein
LKAAEKGISGICAGVESGGANANLKHLASEIRPHDAAVRGNVAARVVSVRD